MNTIAKKERNLAGGFNFDYSNRCYWCIGYHKRNNRNESKCLPQLKNRRIQPAEWIF